MLKLSNEFCQLLPASIFFSLNSHLCQYYDLTPRRRQSVSVRRRGFNRRLGSSIGLFSASEACAHNHRLSFREEPRRDSGKNKPTTWLRRERDVDLKRRAKRGEIENHGKSIKEPVSRRTSRINVNCEAIQYPSYYNDLKQ